MNRVSRLIASSDFKVVLNKGKRISATEFNLYWTVGAKLRVGFMVSKKVSKLAVERNKIKRRLRDIMSKNVPVDFAYSIVITAKPPILQANYQTLRTVLLSKVKMIEIMRSAKVEHKVTRSIK